MFDSRSVQPRTLHDLSHVLQSLLMRLQADFFLLERKTRQLATAAPSDSESSTSEDLNQHVERSKQTIKQLSHLLEHIFECLYLANEKREPQMKTVALTDWQHEIEEHTRLIVPKMKFKKKRWDTTVTMDVQMVAWTIGMLVRAAWQWAIPTQLLTLHTMMPSSRELTIVVIFTPHTQHIDGTVAAPQQNHTPLGEFYWEAANVAAQHLGGALSGRDEAYQGRMQLTLPVQAKS